MKCFNYYKPKSLKEASEILLGYGEGAHILNGGTDLVVRMRDEITTPNAVVDIKGIKELYKMNYDGEDGLFIGACVKLTDMVHYGKVTENYRFLSDAAESIGAGQIRNLATMVGNNCNASPLADTSTPLLVLDAIVVIYGPKGNREISIHEFFKGVRKICLGPGEIVTGIKVPAYENVDGVFMKNSRRKDMDLSTVCTSVGIINNNIHIAMGAVAPTPIRAWEAEKFVKGKSLTDEIINKTASIATSESKPIDDVRSTKEYRREMVNVMVCRSLEKLRELRGEDYGVSNYVYT